MSESPATSNAGWHSIGWEWWLGLPAPTDGLATRRSRVPAVGWSAPPPSCLHRTSLRVAGVLVAGGNGGWGFQLRPMALQPEPVTSCESGRCSPRTLLSRVGASSRAILICRAAAWRRFSYGISPLAGVLRVGARAWLVAVTSAATGASVEMTALLSVPECSVRCAAGSGEQRGDSPFNLPGRIHPRSAYVPSALGLAARPDHCRGNGGWGFQPRPMALQPGEAGSR